MWREVILEWTVGGLHSKNIVRRYGFCAARACLHTVVFSALIQQARRFPRLSVCSGGAHLLSHNFIQINVGIGRRVHIMTHLII
jgi:hypothetical protein